MPCTLCGSDNHKTSDCKWNKHATTESENTGTNIWEHSSQGVARTAEWKEEHFLDSMDES